MWLTALISSIFLLPLPLPLLLLPSFQGSFECGPCSVGYVEQGPLECLISDPCAAGVHDCEMVDYCINHQEGLYYCECPIGMFGNGRQCAPDNDLDGVPNTQLTIGCENPPCKVVSRVTVACLLCVYLCSGTFCTLFVLTL